MIIRTLVRLVSAMAIIHVSVYLLEVRQPNDETVFEPNDNSSSNNNNNTDVDNNHHIDEKTRLHLLDALVFIQRREHMSRVCGTYGRSLHRNVFDDTKDLHHILVDERHKLLYCYVPKVACTNWKRVFMVLLSSGGGGGTSAASTHRWQNASAIPAEMVHRKTAFPRLSDYTAQQARLFIDTYTKWVFVRHPFERLLSAYRNKLEKPPSPPPSPHSKYFQARIGRDIVRRYRANATNASLQLGNDVKFAEFALYLIDRYVPAFNEHWKPISELCHPCLIRYDFVGKYETLLSDAEFLLKAINQSHIRFPRVRGSNTAAQVAHYFDTLSAQVIVRLYNIFILDFKLFGYGTESVLGYEIG